MFVALGPVVRLDDVKAEFLKSLAPRVYDIQGWLHIFKLEEAFGEKWKQTVQPFCFFLQEFCDQGLYEVKNRHIYYPDDVVPFSEQKV